MSDGGLVRTGPRANESQKLFRVMTFLSEWTKKGSVGGLSRSRAPTLTVLDSCGVRVWGVSTGAGSMSDIGCQHKSDFILVSKFYFFILKMDN